MNFSRVLPAGERVSWKIGPVWGAALTGLIVATFILAGGPKAAAGKYEGLAAKGYRWVTVDGPYACPKREDALAVGQHPPQTGLDPDNPTRAYYLVKGSIVQLLETDGAVSRIRLPGITSDLWTMTRFLSRQPLKDAYGITETPETAGLAVEATPAPSGSPGALGLSPTPVPSPIDQLSPMITPVPSPSGTP